MNSTKRLIVAMLVVAAVSVVFSGCWWKSGTKESESPTPEASPAAAIPAAEEPKTEVVEPAAAPATATAEATPAETPAASAEEPKKD